MNDFVVGLLIGALGGFCLFGIVMSGAWEDMVNQHKEELINYGVAHYDTKTGEFIKHPLLQDEE